MLLLTLLLFFAFAATQRAARAAPAVFNASPLLGVDVQNPTSLQFGPDGRLYVAQQNGRLFAYTIARQGPSRYVVTATEEIALVRNMPNHSDSGNTVNVQGRQVTGLYVTGTPLRPILYVTSSDPRIGVGETGRGELNLDTNSGVISRLTWNGRQWQKIDLVRGLPRSEQNHATNGLALDAARGVLYVAQGGNTNAGSPSQKMAFTTEYALSAAVLAVDLARLDALPTRVDDEGQAYKYNLPTLDDPSGQSAPWGGRDGLNQALLVPGGPVQVYSPGYRNPYDLWLTEDGRLYTVDNGANEGWGGYPENEGPQGSCSNDYVPGEPGLLNDESGLHLIAQRGYYGGHPNPIRGNPAAAGLYLHDAGSGVFLPAPTNNWPPVPVTAANPIECDFRQPNAGPGTVDPDASLVTYPVSVNGIAAYTAANFGGALRGDLLMAGFNGDIFHAALNAAGDRVTNGTATIAAGYDAQRPLDITAQGDRDVFPGTVWIAMYRAAPHIVVLEPADYGACVGRCASSIFPVIAR